MVMPHMLPPQQRMQVGICGGTCDREADHQNEDMLPRGRALTLGGHAGAALQDAHLEMHPRIAQIE